MLDKVFEVLTDSPPISGKVSLEFSIFTAILSDPRMDRIFVGTPVQMMTIVAFYLLFIHKLGPNFMKERKQFELQKILVGYNILQIFFNLGIFTMVSEQLNNQITNSSIHTLGSNLLAEQEFLLHPLGKITKSRSYTGFESALLLSSAQVL
jgi:hypothetical protein